MKPKDFIIISSWLIFPLFIILNFILVGCSPFEINEAEKITEEVVEHVIEEDLKGK